MIPPLEMDIRARTTGAKSAYFTGIWAPFFQSHIKKSRVVGCGFLGLLKIIWLLVRKT